VLLAEELVLVAVDPDRGRHPLGARAALNACLAGLLVAELTLDGGDSPLLAAAAEVAAERGRKTKAVLSHMDRGLRQRLGLGTWDAAAASLVAAGILGPAAGSLRSSHPLLNQAARDGVVARLREAAAGTFPVDVRTALVLSMCGPASLLEVVAPARAGRRAARSRIDHVLDGTEYEALAKTVRALIAEDQAAAAVVG
jgi:Golgi phosphoprotein 3 GPP34